MSRPPREEYDAGGSLYLKNKKRIREDWESGMVVGGTRNEQKFKNSEGQTGNKAGCGEVWFKPGKVEVMERQNKRMDFPILTFRLFQENQTLPLNFCVVD